MAQRPSTTIDVPDWARETLRRALGIGPIIGGAATGGLLWVPSRSVGSSVGSGIAMLALLGGLRAVDPLLTPLWTIIAVVPLPLRVLAGAGLPVLFSMQQFQPSASSQEVGRVRTAVLVSALIAYVLMRPRKRTT